MFTLFLFKLPQHSSVKYMKFDVCTFGKIFTGKTFKKSFL